MANGEGYEPAMDRGVRRAGAAADKGRRRILVCDITIHWVRMEKDDLSC